MIQLKPCPICGGEAIFRGIHEIDGRLVEHRKCFPRNSFTIAAWNSRPGEDAARQAALEEACKAMCHYCRGITKVDMPLPGKGRFHYYHGYGNVEGKKMPGIQYCEASHIRRLMEKP